MPSTSQLLLLANRARTSGGSLELINQKKADKGGGMFGGKYTNSGVLHVTTCAARPRPYGCVAGDRMR